jgi:hypothetical protein
MEQRSDQDGGIRAGEPPVSGLADRSVVDPRSRRKWPILTIVAGVVGGLVLVAQGAAMRLGNEFEMRTFDTYNHPVGSSAADAKARDALVCRFKIEPVELVRDDKKFEFGEAWLESVQEPRQNLVFMWRQRANWSYLCVRPKTEWHQGDFRYKVTPEHNPGFRIVGLGMRGSGAGFWQDNEVYFQKVPTDLKEFDLVVSFETYGKGKEIVVGKSHATRID